MENTNIGLQSTSYIGRIIENKQCWICFGTNQDEFEDVGWVSPCKCIGSTKWVHQVCVQRWIDEKLKENIFAKPRCPQCNTGYIIIYKKVNYFVRVLNKLEITCNQLYPFMAAGAVISTVYWSAASYGAITVMQVFGEKEGILMMENTDPYILLLILPTIPFSLVLGKSIIWEEIFLLLLQRFTSKIPLLRNIVPAFLIEPVNISNSTLQLNPVTHTSTKIWSALLFPTCATIIGKLIFDNGSYTKLQKTLFGGLVYIAVKSTLRIYQKQHNVISQRSRLIVNYTDTNIDENYE